MLNQLIKELEKTGNQKSVEHCRKYFKTDKGGYGEGDIFLGVKVPVQRQIAKKYENLSLQKIQKLLNSKIHEHRFTGLIILIDKYKKSQEDNRENIFNFYLNNIKNINNWDLVDVSAHKIVGDFLSDKDKKILSELARSKNLWERRIAIVSTFAFIRKGKLIDTLRISKNLLKDKHDLIHKAVGWMLREVGKKDKNILENFLKKNYSRLPRMTLRYAIERFSGDERKKWLKGV